jgi:chemosensory pili system protein ChpA (sensor histidine kinase/response regulator)
MSLEFDRQALVSIFIAEATDGLAKLAAALSPKDGDPSIPTSDAIHQLFIVAHSLKGAAALYGYERSSVLAGILERAFEQAREQPQQAWTQLVPFARELVAQIKQHIESIHRCGSEGPDGLEELLGRYSHMARFTAVTANASRVMDTSDAYFIPELDTEVFSYFVPEAQEYLETITSSLLAMERDPEEVGELQRLFRAVHTLKGSAYTVGFQSIGDLTHELEDIVDAVLDGEVRLSPELTDRVFQAIDVMRVLLKLDSTRLEQTCAEFQTALRQLTLFRTKAPEIPLPAAAERQPQRAAVGASTAKPRRHLERRKVAAAVQHGDEAVIRVRRDRLERLLNLVGELLIGRSRLEQRLMVLEQLSRQVLTYEGKMLNSVRAFEEKHAFSAPEPVTGNVDMASMLMDFGALEFDKYDDFNILARSMAEVSADIAESMAQLSTMIRQGREDMSRLHQLTLGLRDEIAQARMVPLNTLFTRFQKAVREMGRTAGKEVTLETFGGEIEVDTDMVQRLLDPLIHIVRNAVYHGIEPREAREAAGKSAAGTVSILAGHQGAAVVIEVRDDGAGMNPEKIKAKAIAMGVITPEVAASMSSSEAAELIYVPGFSTASEVGDQAGRGVGMDVVKRAIEGLNGHIEIDSQPGVGTTFTLRLPLTLLISAALIVRLGEQRYALPLPGIREVLSSAKDLIRNPDGRSVLPIGDEQIEVRSLGEVLGQAEEQPPRVAPVVVLQGGPKVMAITVDELLGRQEIVIKTLGPLGIFKGSAYNGAAIDPEGHVILSLDVARLLTERRTRTAFRRLPPAAITLAADKLREEIDRSAARILLIDDSLSVRKFIGRMLEAAGYHVDTAVDGEEGLRKVAAERYRLIITDLEMPKINGYEVLQALREQPATKSVPVMVMTTRAAEKHRQLAMSLGANAYLAKPIEERALIDEVARWIGEPAGAKR